MKFGLKLPSTAWLLTILTCGLAVIAWAQGMDWELSHLSTYQVFPVLGLLAFSIMWSHYAVSFARRYRKADKTALKSYYSVTGYIVLILILLHPGLLIWQLYRDGAGLPPASYSSYVAPSLVWVVMLGTICWLAFMAFELHRWYGERSWWRYVGYASDAAMIGIVYHGLRLGGTLHGGWYQIVWYVYAVLLLAMLGYTYSTKARTRA